MPGIRARQMADSQESNVPLGAPVSRLTQLYVYVPERGGVTNFRISYVPGDGLHIIKHPTARDPVGTELRDDNYMIYDWIETVLGDDSLLGFRSLNVWGYVMVFLQLSALFILSFEAPGMTDVNGVIRYISDNIADHRGFGGVMLISFTGSLLLVSMVSLNKAMVFVTVILIAGSTFGGAGVVLFHGDFKFQHLACACAFISCGLLLHIIAIYTGPWRIRHTVRDMVFLFFTFASTGIFAGFLISNMMYIHMTKHRTVPAEVFDDRDPRLWKWWWISGVSEYVLYINMCILNLFVGQRLFEHTAWSVFKALPILIDKQRNNFPVVD